jgi:hypothetical protein
MGAKKFSGKRRKNIKKIYPTDSAKSLERNLAQLAEYSIVATIH